MAPARRAIDLVKVPQADSQVRLFPQPLCRRPSTTADVATKHRIEKCCGLVQRRFKVHRCLSDQGPQRRRHSSAWPSPSANPLRQPVHQRLRSAHCLAVHRTGQHRPIDAVDLERDSGNVREVTSPRRVRSLTTLEHGTHLFGDLLLDTDDVHLRRGIELRDTQRAEGKCRGLGRDVFARGCQVDSEVLEALDADIRRHRHCQSVVVSRLTWPSEFKRETVIQIERGSASECHLNFCHLLRLNQSNVNVHCRAAWIEAQLEGKPSFEVPRTRVGGRKTTQKPAVRKLPPKANDPQLSPSAIAACSFRCDAIDTCADALGEAGGVWERHF